MPPVSPPPDQQDTADDHSPLSDEDVGILYEIITSAAQDSNVDAQPFRAIFTSYDTVLAQHGLSPDHDQIYLRFLLRLGGNRLAGGTLYDSFEALLAELGIQIEVNTEQNEIQDVTRSVDATARNSQELQARSEAGSDSGVLSRRASFHASAEEKREVGTITRLRSSSRASISDLRDNQVAEGNIRPSTRASIRPSERTERRQVSRQTAPQPARGRLTAREFASNLQHVQRRHASASATRTSIRRDRNYALQRHTRARSNQLPQIQPAEGLLASTDDYQDFTRDLEQPGNGHDRPARSPERHVQAYQVDDRELFYRPTEAQLLRDADDFLHFRTRALARSAMRRWQNIVQESKQRRERMSNMALCHDLGILLRQSFDQWRAVLQSRRQAVAADRYFMQLEQRAHKARDLYLLTKALTHWQQITSDRIKQALQARCHVLRVKYFNAWLELTVVNHRKVQLQGERKFYSLWHRRYSDLTKASDWASAARRRNLSRTAYWKWFWAFCERRAPQWKERRLQSTIFNRWSFSVQQILYREFEIGVRRDESIKRAWFFKWLHQARSVLSHATEADKFYRQKITTRSMLAYQRTIKFTPLVRQVSNMADWRIAGSTFALLVNKLRTQQQAKKVNQLRVLKNSWTAWNDRLRWQTLKARIDDRVIVQALYKWVLAERCVLLQRLCEQRSMHLNLRRLVDRYRARVITQRVIFDDFEKKRQTCMSKLIINRWRHSIDSFRQNAHMALEFETPRITQEAMFAWTEKIKHIRKIDEWASDASYYFRTVRFLRRWRVANAEAKRRRYRDAYAHIRRRNKMDLASSCLQIWRGRAQANNQMQEQARAHDQQQLLRYSTSLFDHWRNRQNFLIDRQDQTLLEFDHRFAHNQLDRWIARYRIQTQLRDLASVHAGLRISAIASNWLHKLQLRIIELKGRESNVELFRRRSSKRHLRIFLRRWSEIFANTRDQQRRQDVEGQNQAARRAGEWTDIDEGLDLGDWIPGSNAKTGSTPFAAHLSTPSKRAARAKEVLKMSTTPAGTPATSRMLSQLGRTPRSVRKGDLGRSNAGFNGSAFGPIQEAPKTPEGT
ncbi:MAG: hypothetical protein L6R38_005693 [Xanthoria sp. 2 TBL-2021]|nr:MAG: hypothetical protein L6R38_005693 [Xanthoria sp. 2 TBL-2021]